MGIDPDEPPTIWLVRQGELSWPKSRREMSNQVASTGYGVIIYYDEWNTLEAQVTARNTRAEAMTVSEEAVGLCRELPR